MSSAGWVVWARMAVGEPTRCDALNGSISGPGDEPRPCGRSARVRYGDVALCWQHEERILAPAGRYEPVTPIGVEELRLAGDGFETLIEWHIAKRKREGGCLERSLRS
jgi:hypothetical protein